MSYEPIFLDADFNELMILDAFESFVWVDRFDECGEVDIKTPPTSELLSIIPAIRYLKLAESQKNMVIEDINIHTDSEDGPSVVITGRSLESMLERRIVWDDIVLVGNLEECVLYLLLENAINPSDPGRGIPDLVFLLSDDPEITLMTIATEFSDKYVYEAIVAICKSKGLGFKLVRVDDEFLFSLYRGTDRSAEQNTYPIVEFSPDYENLISGDYLESSRTYKNVCLVTGEEDQEGNPIRIAVSESPTPTLLARRECFVEVTASQDEMTPEEYIALLAGKGAEELGKRPYIRVFDGSVDTRQYTCNVDYFVGDILSLTDGYGHTSKSRVTEMIYSQDKSGKQIYPTFKTIS